MGSISRRALGLGICGVLALAACQSPAGDGSDWGFRTGGARPKATDGPGKGDRKRPSEAPTASATDTPVTLPPPPSGWSEDHQALETDVAEGLAAVAQVGFLQARSQLDPAIAAQLIGKARLPGIISNNSGSIVGNNGGSYRVRAISETIVAEAEAGEVLLADRRWADGTATRQFVKDLAKPDDAIRRVELDEAGKPRYQLRQSLVTRHPDGSPHMYEKAVTTLYPDGRLRSFYQLLEEHGPDGALWSVNMQRGGYRDANETLGLDIRGFSVQLRSGTGTFHYVYNESDMAEIGTLEGVSLDANGRIDLAYSDPLAFYDGTSEVSNKRGRIYKKRRKRNGGKRSREYTLKKNVVLHFDREEGQKIHGELRINGKAEGKAEQELRSDGTVINRVFFPEAPDSPLVVGYGHTEPLTVSVQPQKPLHVTTIAGGEAGYADGAGDVARFNTIRSVVRSRLDPHKFYVADSGNHRIRVVTLEGGSATVATYAGDGTAGGDDGAALTARFDGPYGLAVGPDDTLYVSDSGAGRIRVIAPDKTVSTLVGDGAGSFADGPSGFSMPAGLTLDGEGRLWVADFGHHMVRRVSSTGVVTTVAGDGTAGLQDGAALASRFKQPSAIAVVGDDVLVLDSGNRRLRAISDGQVSTRAGSGDPGGPAYNAFTDGPALSAGFNALFGLAASADGKTVYLGSRDLRALVDGQVHTVAGSTQEGTDDGTVREAEFTRIFGLALTADDALVVGHEHRLRLVPTR